jgi:hypothetical protein
LQVGAIIEKQYVYEKMKKSVLDKYVVPEHRFWYGWPCDL